MRNKEGQPAGAPVSFEDTSRAFGHLGQGELAFRYWLFRLMNNKQLTDVLSSLADWAVKWHLPIKWAIKATIFRHFCGGENIRESLKAADNLGLTGVGAILDYSVEGQDSEKEFAGTEKEILKTISVARENPNIPVACMKLTGIASNKLLEKASKGKPESEKEIEQFNALRARLARICRHAFECGVPIYIDAEESWLQVAIDNLCEEMMRQFNKERAIVFNTIQLFRHDKLDYFKKLIEAGREENFKVGVKLVRGAYLEKENKRAAEKGYPTPIQPNKAATDRDYNAALKLSIENLDVVEVCAGTHNEESAIYLTQLMQDHGLSPNHPHIYFSQLYGMSDHMSFTLAACGYNVSKYLPYGPVEATLPYLIRRAKENSAMAGQMSKELQLIVKEKKRRGKA